MTSHDKQNPTITGCGKLHCVDSRIRVYYYHCCWGYIDFCFCCLFMMLLEIDEVLCFQQGDPYLARITV